MQGHFPLTRVSSRRLAKSYSTLNAQTPDLVPPPLCLDLITPRSCVSCSEAMGALPTLGRMIDSLGAERNDRSKESYVFATREVIRHVSLFRGHLHLLALRTSFRPSRFSFPFPPHPFLEDITKTRTSSNLAGQTNTAIERWF